MAVTETKKCYFFVYTSHGYFLEEVIFYDKFWNFLFTACLLNFIKKFIYLHFSKIKFLSLNYLRKI